MSSANLKHLMSEAAKHSIKPEGMRPGYVVPILSGWVIEEEGQNVYIVGTIENHSKYAVGSRIKTSQVIRFQEIDRRNIIFTKNSMYELGDPAIQLSGSSQKSYQELQQKINRLGPYIPLIERTSDFTKLTH